jgi:hypothetical protein
MRVCTHIVLHYARFVTARPCSVRCRCVPARIHVAIQTNLRESVGGEERDDEGAHISMGECPTCLNLKLSLNLLVTLFGCVLARILSDTSPDAGQHAVGHAWGICVPARIHLAIQTNVRESVVGGERDDGGTHCSKSYTPLASISSYQRIYG